MIVWWYHPVFGFVKRYISADFEAVRLAYLVRGSINGRYSIINP